MSRSTIFQSCWDGVTASWVFYQYFGELKVSCSRTLHGGRGVLKWFFLKENMHVVVVPEGVQGVAPDPIRAAVAQW